MLILRHLFVSIILGINSINVVPSAHSQDTSSSPEALRFLLEMLVKANSDLTNKFESLQKTVTEQSSEISNLKLQLLTAEHKYLIEVDHLKSSCRCRDDEGYKTKTIGKDSLQDLVDDLIARMTDMEENCLSCEQRYTRLSPDITKLNEINEWLTVHNKAMSDFEVKLLLSEKTCLEKTEYIKREIEQLYHNQTDANGDFDNKIDQLKHQLDEENKELSLLNFKQTEYEETNAKKWENIMRKTESNSDALVLSQDEMENIIKVTSVIDQRLVSIEKKYDTVNDEIKREIQNQHRKQLVSFSARVSPSYKDIEPGTKIIFSNVETNIGDSYNSKTGEFIAPVSGVYVFYCHILSASNKSIETRLQVNGTVRLWLYSGGSSSYRGSGSNLLVIHLDSGDIVNMIKLGPWGSRPFYIHHVWSTFSGFLLRTDSSIEDLICVHMYY